MTSARIERIVRAITIAQTYVESAQPIAMTKLRTLAAFLDRSYDFAVFASLA